MKTIHKKRASPVSYAPQILDFTLYFWNSSSNWAYLNLPVKELRFHVVGQNFGKGRWRPHLIQHFEPLPVGGKKETNDILFMIRDTISKLTDTDCMAVTMDLLDYNLLGDNL